MLCWRRNPRKWRKQRRQVPLVPRGQHGISASSWKSFSGRGWFCFWMKIVMAFVLRAVNFWGINDLTHQTITCRQLLQRHLTWSTGIKAVGTKKFGAFNFYSGFQDFRMFFWNIYSKWTTSVVFAGRNGKCFFPQNALSISVTWTSSKNEECKNEMAFSVSFLLVKYWYTKKSRTIRNNHEEIIIKNQHLLTGSRYEQNGRRLIFNRNSVTRTDRYSHQKQHTLVRKGKAAGKEAWRGRTVLVIWLFVTFQLMQLGRNCRCFQVFKGSFFGSNKDDALFQTEAMNLDALFFSQKPLLCLWGATVSKGASQASQICSVDRRLEWFAQLQAVKFGASDGSNEGEDDFSGGSEGRSKGCSRGWYQIFEKNGNKTFSLHFGRWWLELNVWKI